MIDSSNKAIDMTKELSINSETVASAKNTAKTVSLDPLEGIEPFDPAVGGVVALSTEAKSWSGLNLSKKGSP